MSNITTLVHELKRDKKFSQDVVVAEHFKEQQDPRLSVIIYEAGIGNGIAVVTLEQTDSKAWGVHSIKALNSYQYIEWPEALKTEPTNAGALAIIESLIDCAENFERTKVAA